MSLVHKVHGENKNKTFGELSEAILEMLFVQELKVVALTLSLKFIETYLSRMPRGLSVDQRVVCCSQILSEATR